jgi:hypothetical protein
VAIAGGSVIGHIAFSEVTIDGHKESGLVLKGRRDWMMQLLSVGDRDDGGMRPTTVLWNSGPLLALNLRETRPP